MRNNNRIRYIYINKLRHGLGDGVCYYLIGMHAYTGCDTVSVFAGRGKLGALPLMIPKHCRELFRETGQSWELSADLFKNLQAFTCKLYTSSTRPLDINTARHQFFCPRRGELESTQLPPCEHFHACNAELKMATVEWMRSSPASETVLQLLFKCSRKCKLPVCQFMSNGLKCTNLCKLQTWDNQPQ